MAAKKNAPNRERSAAQAARSERTRTALLAAAEAVFARDGFEASRIEDIAAAGGRSRGAFYANFTNKSEVFLELRSRATARRARELRERILKVTGKKARQAAVQQYVLEHICDFQSLMLQIEFKLYALRHPAMLRELAEKHLEATSRINREELADLFPEKNDDESGRRMTLALEALLEGFALNAMFGPDVLDEAYLEQVVPQLLGILLP